MRRIRRSCRICIPCCHQCFHFYIRYCCTCTCTPGNEKALTEKYRTAMHEGDSCSDGTDSRLSGGIRTKMLIGVFYTGHWKFIDIGA